jgi:transposase InsO family protein
MWIFLWLQRRSNRHRELDPPVPEIRVRFFRETLLYGPETGEIGGWNGPRIPSRIASPATELLAGSTRRSCAVTLPNVDISGYFCCISGESVHELTVSGNPGAAFL